MFSTGRLLICKIEDGEPFSLKVVDEIERIGIDLQL